MQAMDELKVLLDNNSVHWTEKELKINPDGVPNGRPNSAIENLDTIFVRQFIKCCAGLVLRG